MEHDAELTTNSSAPRLLPSTCAVTVNVDGPGLRSLTIQLRETESDELIRNRLLKIDARAYICRTTSTKSRRLRNG